MDDALIDGRYEAAIVHYQEAIAANPGTRPNYWHLGLAYLLQGEAEEAQAIWLSVLSEADLEDVADWMAELVEVLLGEARRLEASDLQATAQICQQILELDDRAEAYFLWGGAVAQQGDYDGAIGYWQQAIGLNPQFIEAYQQQGEVLQKLEQFGEAIDCYTKVLELQPDRIETHYRLGLCLLKQNRFVDSIAHLTAAIQLEPDFAQAWGDRGYAKLQLADDLEAAIADFQTAARLRLDFVEAYDRWQKALTASKPSEEASCTFLNALLSPSIAPEIYLELGLLLAYCGDREAAITCFKQLQESELAQTIGTRVSAFQPLSQELEISTSLSQSPTGFYPSTQSWAIGSESAEFVAIESSNLIYLNPPKSLEKTVHFSFRFGQAIELPGNFVATIPNGRFWLSSDQTSSAIITSENKFLADLSPEFPILSPGYPDEDFSNHAVLSANLPAVEAIDGTAVVLSGLLNDLYFHWMFDVLPRVELLKRGGIDLAEVDRFVVSNHLPFQQETLQALGIPDTKITDRHHIQAKKLIVPSFPGSVAWMPQWTCSFLREKFLSEEPLVTERLYISRRSAANRRVINEDAVIDLLKQFGFRSVTLETLSVTQQATLLASAKVVIASHGGGLTNLVFCQAGTTAIELFSPNYVYSCYWLISNLAQLNYYYLLSEMPIGYHLHHILYPDVRTEDIFVDLDRLLALMNLAGVI